MHGGANALFEFLTNLARDPFEQDAYATDPRGVLARAGLSTDEIGFFPSAGERDCIAGGAWAACQTCSDPGPDPFPEMGLEPKAL